MWSVSVLESRFYQGNMLLRDADANSMAHGLELRVPLLDQRLLDLVHAIPGPVRLSPGAPPKSLLQVAAAEHLRPELTAGPKRGYTLPVWKWMAGALRPVCVAALDVLKQTRLLRPEGVDAVWGRFEQEPATPIWTRAFALCVLGSYLQRTGAAA